MSRVPVGGRRVPHVAVPVPAPRSVRGCGPGAGGGCAAARFAARFCGPSYSAQGD